MTHNAEALASERARSRWQGQRVKFKIHNADTGKNEFVYGKCTGRIERMLGGVIVSVDLDGEILEVWAWSIRNEPYIDLTRPN